VPVVRLRAGFPLLVLSLIERTVFEDSLHGDGTWLTVSRTAFQPRDVRCFDSNVTTGSSSPFWGTRLPPTRGTSWSLPLGVVHVSHRVGPEHATRFDKAATDEQHASTETRG